MAPSRQSTGSAIVRFYDPDVQAKDALGRTQEQILAWSDSQLENSHNYIQVLFPLPEGSPFNYSAPAIDLATMKAFRASSELRQRLGRSFERMLKFYGFTTSIKPEPVSEDKKVAEKEEEASAGGESTPATAKAEQAKEDAADAQARPIATDNTTTTLRHSEKPAVTTPASAEAVPPKSVSQGSPFGYHVVRGSNWNKASRNWCVRFDHNHLRITRILRCLRVLGLQKESDAFFAALKRVYDDPAVGISARSLEFWTRAAERPLHLPPDDTEDECDWLKE